MRRGNCAPYGAIAERGEIVKITERGYIVKSVDRPGTITPPMTDILGSIYNVGDRVIFFMFDDGNGRIIAAL